MCALVCVRMCVCVRAGGDYVRTASNRQACHVSTAYVRSLLNRPVLCLSAFQVSLHLQQPAHTHSLDGARQPPVVGNAPDDEVALDSAGGWQHVQAAGQ